MYTNINSDHALKTISAFLARQPDCYNHAAIINALEIVMRYCYFTFGDTCSHQIQGTAMGAPSAPTYATIYYGIHKVDTLLPTFRNQLVFIIATLMMGWVFGPLTRIHKPTKPSGRPLPPLPNAAN
jgi:hypothetical protein